MTWFCSVRNSFEFFLAAFLLILMIESVHLQTNGTGCYCLKKHLSYLKSPIHIMPTEIDSRDVYLIAEQSGMIYKYDPTKDADDNLKPYLKLTDRIVVSSDPVDERGLLGFALHPNFTTNQKIYLYSIRNISNLEYVAVTEVTGTNLDSEKYLLLVEQPGTKRNGGQLLFGTDGYLYILTGDGGPADDADNQAQNPAHLLGKILRVDVNEVTVADYKIQYYGIPDDNPKNMGWRPEVYGIGIRNMWRCSEDRGDPNTGDGRGRIICGDLGSNIADEINQIVKGGNYGWQYKEGLHCFNQTLCDSIADEQLPLYVLNKSSSNVVAAVGGPVYRGSTFPGLQGHYLYGDYATGKVHSLKQTTTTWTSSDFTECDASLCGCRDRAEGMKYLLSFGESNEGELFLMMTDELTSTAPKGGLFELVKPITGPVTCGGVDLQAMSLVLLLALALVTKELTKDA